MKMRVQQRPCVTVGCCLIQQEGESSKKILTILVIKKNGPFLNAPNDHMLQQFWGVYACMSWHGGNYSIECESVKNVPTGPLSDKILSDT